MARPKATDESIVQELVTIKRLLVFALMRAGATQKEIGGALGIDRSTVSRMFPEASTKGPKKQGDAVDG